MKITEITWNRRYSKKGTKMGRNEKFYVYGPYTIITNGRYIEYEGDDPLFTF